MDRKSEPDEDVASLQMTNDISGLTFGNVLSVLSNGPPDQICGSTPSASTSSMIADKTLQLERRLRKSEAEIATLKDINQIQRDRIAFLERELESTKRAPSDSSKPSRESPFGVSLASTKAQILPPDNNSTVLGGQSLPPSSSSSAPHSDEFARDLQTYYETRCRNLEKMVLEMHRWFSDYDLVWVGENEMDEADALKELSDEQYDEFVDRNAPLNLDALVNSFPNGDDIDDERNLFDDEGDDSSPSLDIFWFANGLKISSYPLMRYDDETWGRQTLEEIAEGFLPSRLQFDFPNGVDLMSRDRRRFVFDDSKERSYPSVRELRARGLLPSADHPGLEGKSGKMGGGASRPSQGESDAGFTPTIWSHGSRVRQKSPVSRYLERVPKVVIDKDGGIRRPREGLVKMLAGRSDESTGSLAGRVIPVRVRVYHRHDDKQVLRVHLRRNQTIGELKRICEKRLGLREGGFEESYELVSDVEMRKYEMTKMELASENLTVWRDGDIAVDEAGWLRAEVDVDAPIRDKLVCLHVRHRI